MDLAYEVLPATESFDEEADKAFMLALEEMEPID